MKKPGCVSHACEKKATLFVKAWGENGWSGLYCDRHAGRVIRLRGRLIRKYALNVTIRPITKYDLKGKR